MSVATLSIMRYAYVMIGFLVKKTFLDGWDHLFGLVALNLISLAIVAFVAAVPAITHSSAWAAVALAAGIPLWCVHVTASAAALRSVADSGSLTPTAYLAGVRVTAGRGALLGVVIGVMALLMLFAVPFYLRMEGMLGPLALGIVLWCAAVVALSLQWFPAVCALLPGPVGRQFKKCFLIFFDNAAFSLFVAVYNLGTLVVSALTAFLVPGIAGMTLAGVEALRLRLYKYDWLEANPKADRKKVPWSELLAQDVELTGNRTLKGLIFPWKD